MLKQILTVKFEGSIIEMGQVRVILEQTFDPERMKITTEVTRINSLEGNPGDEDDPEVDTDDYYDQNDLEG